MRAYLIKARIKRLCAVATVGFLLLILLGASTPADAPAKVERMTFADLNRLITQGDCNCLMVFMASWCGPCKEELPVLNRLFKRYGNQGLRFIGISVDADGPAAIEKVIRLKNVAFPVYWVGEAAVDELNIFGVPMVFMIKKGQIVEKIPGKCSYEYLETKILVFLKP